MIYYPLSTLVSAGIGEILIITTKHEEDQFRRLLGDGTQWGLHLKYAVQAVPEGIAQALQISADFLAGEPVALILGDNVFHGSGVQRHIQDNASPQGGCILAYRVARPSAYGVIEFDTAGRAVSLEEKPTRPASPYAVPGLYLYNSDVVSLARHIRPSARGELEITAVNLEYLRRGELTVTLLDRETTWFDTGTFEDLAQASEFVRVTERRHGIRIGCVEEAAWRAGFIDDSRLRDLAIPLIASGYGEYLLGRLQSTVRRPVSLSRRVDGVA